MFQKNCLRIKNYKWTPLKVTIRKYNARFKAVFLNRKIIFPIIAITKCIVFKYVCAQLVVCDVWHFTDTH